ncbi:MAG: response regulator [Syntrophobacteraceae bacterium]
MEQLRVVLVDDEEEFSSALAERLNLRGIVTKTAGSGAEALVMIDADPPEVVVLDKLMPGLSGLELLARIRSKHPGIPVILLTGHDSPELDDIQPDLKPFAFLVKPVDIDHLLKLIHSAAIARG